MMISSSSSDQETGTNAESGFEQRLGTSSEDDEEDSSENDAWFVSDHPLPPIMGPDDPRRMKLTREERDWARDVKDMVEMMPEIENLSDFCMPSLALVFKDNIVDAVKTAKALQEYRREYNIAETLEDGCQNLRSLIDMFPEHYLSFSFSHQDGMYVNIVDMTKCKPSESITRREDEMHWFAGSYYMMHTLFPDLESIRKGCITLAECEGMGLSQKDELKLMMQLYQALFSSYPFRGKVKNYHTGTVYNIVATMLKKVLPSEVAEHFELGCVFECRLSDIYLVPTVELSNERLLHRVEDSLRKRFVNEQSFFL